MRAMLSALLLLAACKVGGRVERDLGGIPDEPERDRSGRDESWERDREDRVLPRQDPPAPAPPDGATDEGRRAPPSMPPPTLPPPADCYREELRLDVSVADVVADHRAERWESSTSETLVRRWPAGAALLEATLDDPGVAGWVDPESPATLAGSLRNAVHEATHGWDYAHSGDGRFAFFLTEDLIPSAPWIHVFARFELLPRLPDTATAAYAARYLAGPQGALGFTETVEELNAYTNGLAVATALGDLLEEPVAARDGVFAMLFYLELSLRHARELYPDLYERMQAEQDYVDLILVLWQRARFFLEASGATPSLGESDRAIAAHSDAPANVREISTFVGRDVGLGPCLP